MAVNQQDSKTGDERRATRELRIALEEQESDSSGTRRYQLYLRLCEHCGSYHPREHWYYYLEGKPSPYCHEYNLMLSGSQRFQCKYCGDFHTIRHFCRARGAGRNHEYQPHSEQRKRS